MDNDDRDLPKPIIPVERAQPNADRPPVHIGERPPVPLSRPDAPPNRPPPSQTPPKRG